MAPLSSSPKLAELKLRVYALAGVSSTKALKAAQPALIILDFRRKCSWQEALEILAQPCGDEQTFDQWLEEPPEEYRELFAEINTVSSAYQKSIDNLRRVSHELIATAEELEHQASVALDSDALHGRN